MPVWEKWGVLCNLLGYRTLMTLLPKWFWSVKIKTNQTYDKCLRSGSRVFTFQQLAFKTKELCLKMNWTQPMVFHITWESDKLTDTVYKAHQVTGIGYECRWQSPSLHGGIYFYRSAHTHTYNMIWFPWENQNCQIITTFLILNLS